MYMSQEMPNLRCFLARFLPSDNNIEKLDFGDGLQELVQSFLFL